VDLQAGVLAIRRTKFGKSRFVPVHASTRRALARYAAQRDVRVPHPTSPAAFLLAQRGTRLTQCVAELGKAPKSGPRLVLFHGRRRPQG
jgi:integrase/recombinase XerD